MVLGVQQESGTWLQRGEPPLKEKRVFIHGHCFNTAAGLPCTPFTKLSTFTLLLFSLLSVFSLSSFLEDLIKFLSIWIQLGLLLCSGQILPSNIKGNCRITGSQDRIGPQRSQSQYLSAWDQNPEFKIMNQELVVLKRVIRWQRWIEMLPMSSILQRTHRVLIKGASTVQVVEILLFSEGSLRWQACLESLSKHIML